MNAERMVSDTAAIGFGYCFGLGIQAKIKGTNF